MFCFYVKYPEFYNGLPKYGFASYPYFDVYMILILKEFSSLR